MLLLGRGDSWRHKYMIHVSPRCRKNWRSKNTAGHGCGWCCRSWCGAASTTAALPEEKISIEAADHKARDGIQRNSRSCVAQIKVVVHTRIQRHIEVDPLHRFCS